MSVEPPPNPLLSQGEVVFGFGSPPASEGVGGGKVPGWGDARRSKTGEADEPCFAPTIYQLSIINCRLSNGAVNR